MTRVETISKSQLDQLGSRLRNSPQPSDEDLITLNRYRERFVAMTELVVNRIRKITSYPIDSRQKSIPSIIAKLRRRQPARLSAIQDLAGARIIVPHTGEQDGLVTQIAKQYADSEIDDKRTRPSFGYRAVHIIVYDPVTFEIQVRTELQHAWAQLSERLADRYGFELKYGGGPNEIAAALLEYAAFGAAVENALTTEASGPAIGNVRTLLERLPLVLEKLRVE